MIGWTIRARRGRGLATVITLLAVTTTGVADAARPSVTIPERSRVCMVHDTVTDEPAIPFVFGGMTYYVCEKCRATTATDPGRSTSSHDPVTGGDVDKATAVLLCVDGRIYYFESDVTRGRFRSRLHAPGCSTGPE